MSKEFQDFVRKQFPVQAARVTPLNIEELAEACGGKIMHDGDKEGQYSRDYIKVRVAFPLNEEQTRARIGDWLVKQGRTFKVYKDKPFRSTFENRDGTPVPAQKQPKAEPKPSPANMPKKKTEQPDNQVADAVEQTPPPAEETPVVVENAKIVGATLSEGPADPSKGVVHPVEVSEPEQKKPITLDELNEQPGDPRTADDIHREGQQQS